MPSGVCYFIIPVPLEYLHAKMLTEHRAIIQAIAARDIPATVSAMQTHFKNGLEAAE
jgi:DNA-binding GntR family transcriptional regulator